MKTISIPKTTVIVMALAMLVILAACGDSSAPATTTAPAAQAPAASVSASSQAAQNTPSAGAGTIVAATAAPTSAAASSDTVTLVLVPANSEARYRVREQLARVSLPSDAIGSTKSISGTIVAKTDGTIVSSASKFVVDLRTLKSDQNQRDNFLGGNVLQTNQYPYAVFIPTSIEGLSLPLADSADVSFTLTGDLTIRNVTKPVTWTVTGKVQNGEATGTATTSFTFEYFNLQQPQVPVVLSVVDNITLELDLNLQPAGI
jgi:polyisoprenoid-binding protein YceI